jgi:acid phosphatase
VAALAAAALAAAGAITAVTMSDPAEFQAAIQPPASTVPQFDHIALVMFENKNYSSISGSSSAPYFNSLASQGAKFTNSVAITHTSQPNYVALLSGSTQGIIDDPCPINLGNRANLGQQLIGAGRSFTGYSESMPSDGYTGCSSGTYQRKHKSWVDFSNVPATSNIRYSSFPTDYTTLPTVSFVTPNMCNDMHDCSVATGDTWLRTKFDAYAQWAKTHNSLLIVTFDENAGAAGNQVFTTFVGTHVTPGAYSESINHYTVLRTIEAPYGLPAINGAAAKSPILDVWQ